MGYWDEDRYDGSREDMFGPGGKHADCPCGCGELADECMTGSWVERMFGAPPRPQAPPRER